MLTRMKALLDEGMTRRLNDYDTRRMLRGRMEFISNPGQGEG
jgi:hypothetical protein